uniref:Uncharacterized protein n=1 Tax=Arundo donax TaxID=35708 RepID=A0A0A8Z7J7_ARUDO
MQQFHHIKMFLKTVLFI